MAVKKTAKKTSADKVVKKTAKKTVKQETSKTATTAKKVVEKSINQKATDKTLAKVAPSKSEKKTAAKKSKTEIIKQAATKAPVTTTPAPNIKKLLYDNDAEKRPLQLFSAIKKYIDINQIIFRNTADRHPSELIVINENGWATVDAKIYNNVNWPTNNEADIIKNLPTANETEAKGLIIPIRIKKDQLFTIWVYQEQNPLKKDIEIAELFLTFLLFEYQLIQSQKETNRQQELLKQTTQRLNQASVEKLQELETKFSQEKEEQINRFEQKLSQTKQKLEAESKSKSEAFNNDILNLKNSLTVEHQKSLTELESKLNNDKQIEINSLKTDFKNQLHSIENQNQQSKKESELKIAELNSLIETSAAKIIALQESADQIELNYLQQIEDINSQNSDSIEKLNQEHNNIISKLDSEKNQIIEQNKTQYATLVDQLKQDHANEINHLKQANSKSLIELEQTYTNKIQDLNQRNNQIEQDQKEKIKLFENQLNNQNRQWQLKLESTEKELTSKYESEIETLKISLAENKANEIISLTETFELQIIEKDDQIKKLSTDLEAQAVQLTNTINQQKQDFEQQIEQLSVEKNSNVVRLNNEHANELESLRKKHANENSALLTSKQTEISELNRKNRESIESIDAAHQAKIQQLTKTNSDAIAALQDQITDLENSIDLQRKEFEQEKLQIEATHKTLIDGLQVEINNRNQSISKQKEELLTLQEAFETNQHNFEQERYEFHNQREQLNQKIIRIEEESLLISEELNATIRDRETKIEALNQSISQLHIESTNYQQNIETLTTQNSSLSNELNRFEIQVHDLNQAIEKQKQSHQAEKDQFIEAAKQEENRWQKYKAEIDSTLQEKDSEIQSKNNSIQKLNSQLNSETERAHNLQNDLEATRTENQEYIEQNQGLQKAITDLQSENSELQDFMRSKNDEIRNYHMQEQSLKRSLQSEEQARTDLETSIEKFKLLINEKDTELSQGQSQLIQLSTQITQLNKQIETYNHQIEQKKASITDLQNDLNRAQSQAKNARKEGILMAEASRALSSQPTFEAKVDWLRNNVLKDFSIERIIFYSIDDNDQLTPTYAIPEFNFAKTSLPLRDTVFGQVMASQKPAILQKQSGEMPLDLPSPDQLLFLSEDNDLFEDFTNRFNIAKRQTESTMILPLVLGAQTNGILLLTTTHLLNENKTNMELLEHLMPFVAATYHDEQDQKRVNRLSQIATHLRTAQKFIQKRNFDLFTFRSKELDDESREHLSQKIRFIAPLIELTDLTSIRESNFETQIESYLEQVKTELKTTLLYPNFNITVEHLFNLVNQNNEDLQYLFWFIAEVASNAIEHSDARRLLLHSYIDKDITVFQIEDDGEGLIRKTGSMNPTSGQGFSFLKSVAGLYGLELRIGKGEGGLGTAYTLTSKFQSK